LPPTHTTAQTYTEIHPIIVVARVLTLTHMAKDCFEEVQRVVVLIVTLYVVVQTRIGNTIINTITVFAVAAATRSGIVKGEKRSDVNIYWSGAMEAHAGLMVVARRARRCRW